WDLKNISHVWKSHHPRLDEADGGRQSIAGSMHKYPLPFLAKVQIIPLPFLAKVQIIPQTPEYKRTGMNNNLTHIGSTCGEIKRTCAFTK
ncbi:unnamed protein product, partial [Musa textilis]